MTIPTMSFSAPHEAAHEPPRKTGLEAVGDAPWGTHFCLLHATHAELLETLAPYFAQGLAANEFLHVDHVTNAHRRGSGGRVAGVRPDVG